MAGYTGWEPHVDRRPCHGEGDCRGDERQPRGRGPCGAGGENGFLRWALVEEIARRALEDHLEAGRFDRGECREYLEGRVGEYRQALSVRQPGWRYSLCHRQSSFLCRSHQEHKWFACRGIHAR